MRVENDEFLAVTSVVSLTEVLIHPLRHNDVALENRYLDLLLHTRNVQTLPLDTATCTSAARLRARYNLRTPDALQIASAIEAGCDAFLTNDLDLKRVQEISILVLSELEI